GRPDPRRARRDRARSPAPGPSVVDLRQRADHPSPGRLPGQRVAPADPSRPLRDHALGLRRGLPSPRTTRKAGVPGMTVPLALPADDRDVSPRTGYTRAHWEATADALLTAAWRWSTPGRALLDLPGRPSRSGARSDGLEGYARTF